MENQKRAYQARYILLRPRDDKSKVGFNDLQRYVLNKLKEKYLKKKEVVITDADNLQKYIKAFKFLKLKSRRKFFRKHKKHFRS
jgi:hypothetical protein